MPMENKTKYFIIGIITGLVAIPVVEELLNVVNAWIQVLLIKPNKIVLKGNKELTDIQAEQEEIDTFCVGFQAPNNDEYYDDEDV